MTHRMRRAEGLCPTGGNSMCGSLHDTYSKAKAGQPGGGSESKKKNGTKEVGKEAGAMLVHLGFIQVQ